MHSQYIKSPVETVTEVEWADGSETDISISTEQNTLTVK